MAIPPIPIGHEYGTYPWISWFTEIRTGAEAGKAALSGLDDRLNKNAADVLNSTITFNTLGAFKVGTVTWDGSSATGTGVMFTQNGIVGASSGTVKFVIKSDGTAIFGGNLTAATITGGSVEVSSTGSIYSTGKTSYSDTDAGFWIGYDSTAYKINIGDSSKYLKWTGSNLEVSGDVNTTGFVKATGRTATGSYYAAITGQASQTDDSGGYFDGVSYGAGLIAITNNAVWGAIEAINTGSGPSIFCGGGGGLALQINGTTSTNGQITSTLATGTKPLNVTSTTVCTNLNADLLDGNHSTAFAAASHTHTVSDLTSTTTYEKFQYSTDAVTWVNIYLRRYNW